MKHKSYLKSKLNQKPQFLSTLLANFWYFTISRHVPNGNLLNFGPSPPQKTLAFLDLCEMHQIVDIRHFTFYMREIMTTI